MTSNSRSKSVVCALNNLIEDGVVLPSADISNVEALIQDLF